VAAAESHFGAAIDGFASLGFPYWLATAQTDLADLLVHDGPAGSARRCSMWRAPSSAGSARRRHCSGRTRFWRARPGRNLVATRGSTADGDRQQKVSRAVDEHQTKYGMWGN
jgi:hypothetical protein